MRLINAEQFDVVGLKGVTKDFSDGVEYILEQIDNAPAVDAVEVIRCKDCKYWGDEDGISEKDGIRFAWCNIHNHCMHGEYIGWCPKEDDFCSFGERREENEID